MLYPFMVLYCQTTRRSILLRVDSSMRGAGLGCLSGSGHISALPLHSFCATQTKSILALPLSFTENGNDVSKPDDGSFRER